RVQAKGQNYNGAPILALSINGRQVSTNDVPGTGFYSNSFGSFYLKGGDSVDVTFTNDAYGGNSNSDRNAYVDYLMIDGVNGGGSPAPTPSPTPQSAGAPGCGYNLWGNLYVGPNETYKNIQSAVNAAWNGATIVVRSGTYRETVKVNKSVKILGECGATVKGSDVWSGFWQEGNSWVKNYSPAYGVYSQCDSNSDGRCGLPDEVFIDGVPQTQRTWQGGLKGNDFWVGNGKIYLSNNPNGHYVEVATRSVWMQGDWGAGGVTIKGLAFMHSTSPALTAALSDNGGGNWTFDGNDIGYSAGAGVSIFGYGSVVKNNLIHDNGQTGVKGQGQNELVDGNKIYNNNTEAFDGSWESGGAKFVGATNLTVQNNVVYNNHAPALWTDVSCDYVTFQYNVIHDNDRQGIHYELSNHGSIHDNAIWSNGYGYSMWPLGSGILVQNSTNTEVFNNTIAWNADGIGVIQMDRGQWTTMQNIYIHNNVIAGTTGNLIGFVSNAGSPSVTASWTNNRTAWNQVYQAGNSNFSWLYDNSDFNSWRSQSRDNGSWKVDHNTLAGLLNGKGVPVLN
ncbi:MAG TPA: right-handed parallel beta-helix repeat-containing protein, partial [Deinococcales bacterium]|nr:right-handed parallel beta-helix repeat-containing protein [Deinococcales bacterium]